MKKLVAALVLTACLAGISPGARAQEPAPTPTASATPAATEAADHAAKIADIKELMRITGAAELGMQMMDELMASIKPAMPQVPEQFWTDFRNGFDPNELNELIVPLYDKYMSHEDIAELLKFYHTPTGKRFLIAQPHILHEAQEVGKVYGRKLAEKVIHDLQQKGYQPTK